MAAPADRLVMENTPTCEVMKPSKTNIVAIAAGMALLLSGSRVSAQSSDRKSYLDLDAGMALQQDVTIEETGGAKLGFAPGFRLDVSEGLHLSDCWRAEVQVGFIYNGVDSIARESLEGEGLGYLQMPLIANAIYRLPLHGPIRADIGAGFGGVYGILWQDIFASDGFSFAYQGILGVKYAVNEGFELGVCYKLLGTFEHELGGVKVDGALSHSILARFTFKW